MRFCMFILVLFFSAAAHAGEITRNDVSTEGDTYHMAAEAVLDAPYAQVHALLTDYAHLHHLNPAITHSEILRHEKNALIVRVVTEKCVLFFCQKIINTQRVEEPTPGHIIAHTLPEQSNLKSGAMEWDIHPLEGNEENKTVVYNSASFTPAFWVPPLIGPMVIRSTLQEEAVASMQVIETLANNVM